ncbi:MAG TPA: DMT family transporter, partial [Candidatus Limnocylindrales bacterium]
TIVLAAFFLHDEPITINRLVGLGVGFIGVLVLTSKDLAGGVSGDSLLGQLALIGSSLAYAFGAVYARRSTRGLEPMIPAFFQVAFAFVISTALALVVDRPWTIDLQPRAAFAVAWLGIFGSGFAYLFFYRLIRNWGSTRTTLVAYLLPVVGIIAGFAVLNETVDARLLLGTAFIVGGVALVNSRYGARRLYGRATVSQALDPPGSPSSPEPYPPGSPSAPEPDRS